MNKKKTFAAANTATQPHSHTNKKWANVPQYLKIAAMVFWVVLFSLPVLARSERPDLNDDFSDAQRKELCELLNEWLTLELIEGHGQNIARFESTNDFLRWNRDQIRDLEKFLMRANRPQYVPLPKWDPSKPVPSYFNGRTASGAIYNNISSKCTNDWSNAFDHGCRASEDYSSGGLYEFNQSGSFNGYLPLNPYLDKNQFICDGGTTNVSNRTYIWGNMSDMSDFIHYFDHRFLHNSFDYPPSSSNPNDPNQFSVSGASGFGNPSFGSTYGYGFPIRMTASFIYWPMHAFYDDIWFEFDNCMIGRNVSSNTYSYTITNGYSTGLGTTVWDNPNSIIKILGTLTVSWNSTLIIKSGQIVEFLDDYYSTLPGGILVQKGDVMSSRPGGRLIIEDGAILRGITSLGTDINTTLNYASEPRTVTATSTPTNKTYIYPDRKMYYLSGWKGIEVEGYPNELNSSILQGRVEIDGSSEEVLIQEAEVGIRSINGGVIKCTGARFLNCQTSVDISNYTKEVTESYFKNSIFERGDQRTKYFTDDNAYAFRKNDFRDLVFVELNGAKGVGFSACTFINTDPNIFDHDIANNRGTGIYAVNSDVYLHKDGNATKDELTDCPVYDGTNKCSFEGLSYGIRALADGVPTGAWDGHLEAQDVEFTDCFVAADVRQSEDAKFYDCTFTYDEANALFNAATSANPQRFVYCKGNLRAVVHGKKTEDPPMSGNLIYSSTLSTNSPIATLIEMDGGTSNYFNRVIANQLQNTSPSPASHGVLTRNDNSNSEITCNSFEGFTGAIYNLGSLKDHTKGDPGNEFMDPSQGMEVHLRTDGTPPTSFRYTNFTGSSGKSGGAPNFGLDVTPNVTITNGGTGTGELRCELTCRGEHVGIDEIVPIMDAFIYPNPNSGIFTIVIGSQMTLKDITVEVSDQFGRVVLETTPTSYKERLNFVQPAGVYIVQIMEDSILKSRTKMVIME